MFRHSTKPAKGDNTFKQLFGRHGSKSPANVSATSQVSNISLSTTGSLSSSGNLVPTLTTAQSKLWDKAVSRLSQTDRDTIDFTNPDKVGILEEVELEAQRSEQLCVEKQWKFLWKGEDVFLKDVASKLVGWISKFTDIGDIVIQYDPGHSAIPWAGFRLLLKIVTADLENMAFMLVSLEYTARCINRCAIYERLYLGVTTLDTVVQLEQAMSDLYTSILEFQLMMLKFYRRNTALRALKALSNIKVFQDGLETIKEREEIVRQGAVLVHDESHFRTTEAQKVAIDRLKGELSTLGEPLTRIDRNIISISADIGDLSLSISGIQSELKAGFFTLRQDIARLEKDRYLSKLEYAKLAPYNSRQNEHKALCLENTRVNVLEDIERWSINPASPRIYWINGRAGTGKSTIARTFAKRTAGQGRLAGSFFFSKGRGDLGNASRFIATIAFQFAHNIPGLGHHISEAIAKDESVNDQIMIDQWKALIQEPISSYLTHTSAALCYVLVLDALDECEGDQDVQLILRLLSGTTSSQGLNLRVLITSRPEIPIRLGFQDMPEIMHYDLFLHNISKDVIEHDLTVYFRVELDRIRKVHALPLDWISDRDIQHLVRNADKLFIYAVTTCRFIDQNKIPRLIEQRLSLVLKTGSTGLPRSVTRELDGMYTQILIASIFGNCDDPDEREQLAEEFRLIIGALTILFDSLSVVALSNLYSIAEKEIDLCIDPLHSVLDIPNKDKTDQAQLHIQFLHPSFRDFLTNKDRCTDTQFQIDDKEAHTLAFEHCLTVLSNLTKDICGFCQPGILINNIDPTTINEYVLPHIRYACRYWANHLKASLIQPKDNGSVHKFFKQNFLCWLEVLSLSRLVSEGVLIIQSLLNTIKPKEAPKLFSLISDVEKFISSNRYIIENAPLQVYSSALLFSPWNSETRCIYMAQYKGCVNNKPLVDLNWDSLLHTLYGHSKNISTVAFSADGARVASGSYDHTIELWDAGTGILQQTLESRCRGSNGVILSSDNSPFVPESRDIKFYPKDSKEHVLYSPAFEATSRAYESYTPTSDPEENEPWHSTNYRQLTQADFYNPKRDDFLVVVVFSPDNTQLASGFHRGKIELWDTGTGTIKQTLKGHTSGAFVLAFSADGTQLISGSGGGIVELWNVTTGVIQQSLEAHQDEEINGIAFSPDGMHFVSAASGGEIKLWNVTTCEKELTLKNYTGKGKAMVYSPGVEYDSVESVVFSSDGRHLISASHNGLIKLWDITTIGFVQQIIEVDSDNYDWFDKIQLSLDGTQLASALDDGTIKIWNLTTNKEQSVLRGHSGMVSAMAFSPDGKQLVSGSDNGVIKIWNTGTDNVQEQPLESHSDSVDIVVFSPDGAQFASGSKDGTIKLRNITTGEEQWVLRGCSGRVKALAFSSDGLQLASGSSDGAIKLWNTRMDTIQELTLESHSDGVNAVAFSPNGAQLVSSSDDGTIKSWNTMTGAIQKTIIAESVKFDAIAYSSNGSRLAFVAKGEVVSLGESEKDVIVYGLEARNIDIWNMRTGTIQQAFKTHSPQIKAIAFSPDDAQLWLASQEINLESPSTIELWDLSTFTYIYSIQMPLQVEHMSLSPDNFILFTNVGEFNLNLDSHEVCSEALGLHYNRKSGWVTCNGQNILWLWRYRGLISSYTIYKSFLVLGFHSGKVMWISIDPASVSKI